MCAQSLPSDQCHWNPANQTPFLKTVIAKYDIQSLEMKTNLQLPPSGNIAA